MLQVGKASSWSTGSVSSPPSRVADPSRGRTAKVTRELTAYLECTLSNDATFVEILVKTTENIIRYCKPPYKFAGHMTVSNLL